MTKIQELAYKIKGIIDGLVSPRTQTMLFSMIDELAGIAEAPQAYYTAKDFPPDDGEGYSQDVLIDLDGRRKQFAIGWYDHDNNRWYIRDEDSRGLMNLEHMTWTYLPLNREE